MLYKIKKFKFFYTVVSLFVLINSIDMFEIKLNDNVYLTHRFNQIEMKQRRILRILRRVESIVKEMNENALADDQEQSVDKFIQIVSKRKLNQKESAITAVLNKIKQNG